MRYTLPSKLINDIYEKMHRRYDKNKEGGKEGISRLVLSDLRTLFEHHNEEANDIIAYLVDLFSKHGITSIFIYTVSDVEDILHSSMADRFENIIVTRYFEGVTSGRRYLSVRVRKYDGISVNNPLHELVYDIGSSPVKISAERGVFQNLIEVQPGKVGFGKLIVRYYSKETQELTNFWNRMKSSMLELFPIDIRKESVTEWLEFKPFSFESSGDENISDYEAVLESVAKGAEQARYPISDILMFDEFWARNLVNRLAPINKIDPEFQLDNYLNKAKYPAMLSPVLSEEGDLCGIPLYGNCSFLVYDRGILKDFRDSFYNGLKEKIDEYGNIRGDITWKEIYEIITIVRAQEQYDKLQGVHVDTFSGECSSGFFLELLWGIGIVDEDKHEILPEIFLKKEVINVLDEWNQNYTSSISKEPILLDKELDIPGFLFCRMWYTRYVSLKARNPELDLGVIKIPCLGKEMKSVSLSGNWYIGVLNGSINLEWAVSLAKWLTSYKANDMIARTPIALPTFQAFWENELVDPEIESIYETVKQRSEISNYIHIRPFITDACHKVVLQSAKRIEIEAAMTKLSKQIKVINEQQKKGLL